MGDKVLRSIEDFIVEQAHAAKHTVQTAGTDNCDSERGTPLSPNAASPEPSVEPSTSSSPEHSIDQSQQAKSSPASNEFLIRSVVRTLVGGLFLVIVVAVAWQTYQDDQTSTLIKALAHSSVSWLSSSLKATQRDSASSAQSVAKTSDQVVQMPTATSMQANEVAEVRQQLLAVVNDLAVMRRDVEQLSSKHEQLSRDVETVQATVQGVTEKISSFSQPVPAPTQAQRRSVPRLVRAEIPRRPPDSAPVSPKTSQQSAAAPIPPTTSPTGTATLSEQPPRPPLPVPTAEAPSPLH
jgi:chromosome segregation ATPase